MRPTHTPALAHAHRRIPLRAVLLVGAALAFLIVGVTRDAGLLSRQHFNVRPVRLVLGTAAEMALLAWGVFLWSRILACFDGPQPRFRALLRVWCGSTLAKYLPGSIWSVAATAGMAREAGASPVALPSSFLLQGALNFVGAISLAALAQASAAWFVPHMPVWLVAALVIGALALVHPVVVSTLVRAGARAARRTAPEWHGSWPGGALLLALHVATWAAYGATFALFLSGIVPIGGVSWTHLAGINALAYTAGFLAFFAPAGLGVREAALVGLLVPLVPGLGARVAVAASSRLWLVLTEVAGGALIVGATTAHTRSTRRRYLTPVDGLPEERRLSAAADDVELLTDTRAALGVMTGACRGATRSIWIAQLAFDADCAPVPTGAEPTPQPLLDAILEAARRPRDHDAAVDVRIVLNGGLLLDTTPALRSAIAAAYDGTNVRVRALKAFPRVLHTKLLIVDERDAFLMGASFVNGYWDGARHVASGDPTATPGTGERPLHDVAVRVRGSTLPALSRWFLELWGDADRHTAHSDERDTTPDDVDPLDMDDAALASAAGSLPDVDRHAVRILRTAPPGGATRRDGHTEILDAYLEAIAGARECIYLESQYFSARPIARAVRDALDANAGLELILVINQNPDITAYRGWQDARLAEHELLGHPRVGVFALWSVVPAFQARERREITQVFVHSKVAVIDDAWATTGTANLDGASLHSYGDDFVHWPGRRVFGRYRNYDLNVAFHHQTDAEATNDLPGALRRRLWAHHLGLPAEALRERPADGWLPVWRSCAARNVTCLAAGDRTIPRGRVLPYVARAPHPRDQLRALGIDDEVAGLDLRFDPSRLDAVCNLGWMKRMIPERMRRWS